MSDLVPAGSASAPARVALADDAPSIEELFRFAREAELRVRALRMLIEERSLTARGEETISHEILLRHPGRARVTTRHGDDPMSRDYEVWLGDGETATTYKAAANTTSRRPLHGGVSGREATDLPLYARQVEALTRLPAGTLADTFVHPHGLFRNVLVTGPLAIVGTQPVAGREAIVVRARHPRTSKVLVDRPDRVVEVGIDRATGFLLLLTERVGDTVTHQAEVTALDIDPTLHDAAFELHIPDGARRLY